jgi:DNA-binding transcriptional ArsR family regulator
LASSAERTPRAEVCLDRNILERIYSDIVNATLSALAEPNRLQIVELLRDTPRPVGDIAKRLRLRQPQVSKHLRVLSEAGLVEARPVAQKRIYQLRSEPFDELDTWLESFRRAMADRYDRLDDLVRERKSKKGEKRHGD